LFGNEVRVGADVSLFGTQRSQSLIRNFTASKLIRFAADRGFFCSAWSSLWRLNWSARSSLRIASGLSLGTGEWALPIFQVESPGHGDRDLENHVPRLGNGSSRRGWCQSRFLGVNLDEAYRLWPFRGGSIDVAEVLQRRCRFGFLLAFGFGARKCNIGHLGRCVGRTWDHQVAIFFLTTGRLQQSVLNHDRAMKSARA